MICMRQIERISAGETDFSREFPLGSAIPFPERMEGVEVPVVFCQDIHKLLFISRSTFALRIVCLEDAVRITWNILYEAEQVSFSDVDRTRFSCPILTFPMVKTRGFLFLPSLHTTVTLIGNSWTSYTMSAGWIILFPYALRYSLMVFYDSASCCKPFRKMLILAL